MANICSFSMLVKGEKENIKSFVQAMEQKGNLYMGRGASVYENVDDAYDEETKSFTSSGSCKWSISSSLVDNAFSMKKQKETGEGNWYDADGFISNHEFISLFEACEKFRVNVEMYSEEPGCGFQEHIVYENGEIRQGSMDFNEVWFNESEYTIEEFREKYNVDDDLDDEEVMELTFSEGGYESWDFDLADVEDIEVERD